MAIDTSWALWYAIYVAIYIIYDCCLLNIYIIYNYTVALYYVHAYCITYRIVQNFDGPENCDEFDERPAIRQSFPFQLFPVNAFPMKPTINSSKFCSSNFLTCLIRQISSDGFSTVKVFRYTVCS